jgi:spermidine/putrescine transport system ATP-binding protein
VTKPGVIDTPLGPIAMKDAIMSGEVHVAIRPEHVAFGGKIAATVQDVVYQGSFRRVAAAPAAAPQMELLCRVPAETSVAVGDKVKLSLSPAHLILLKD